MDAVRLKNMQFFAYHGRSRGEAEDGQRFEVDIELKGSLRVAGLSDDLKDTYDYDVLYREVADTVTGAKYQLIEALAEEICRRILHVYPNAQVSIVIRKPHLPVKGINDGAEVQISRGPVQDKAIASQNR